MKQISIICLILFALNANSQNDTLYLFNDHIQLKGVKYNCMSENLKKTGSWIDFGIYYGSGVLECASGYDPESNVDCHWYTNSSIIYRPLKENEKEGFQIITSTELDTSFRDKRYYIKAEEIRSKIPAEEYFIEAKGKYDNGKKTGLWTFYYKTGVVRKRINYNNDIPVESFKVYRENRTLMMNLEKINNSKWKLSKYSEKGNIIELKIVSIEDFKMLY